MFMTVRKGNCSNGQGGRKTIWSWGRGRDPKLEKTQREKRKRDWCEDERRVSEGRYSRDGIELGARKRYSMQWVMSFV
jgi:hypothetical protein